MADDGMMASVALRAPTRRAPRMVRAGLVAGAVVMVAAWWVDTTGGSVRGFGPSVTAAGRLAGLVAAYVVLVQLLLLARVPWFERAVGLDRLAAWHRALGTNVVLLIGAHIGLVIWGYGLTLHHAVVGEAWTVATGYPDTLLATGGAALFVLVAVTSGRAVRRRLSYEAWYWVHVTTYVAVALTFFHQVATGVDFVGRPLNRALWTAMYLAVAACIVVCRVGAPARQWARHRMTVARVVPESDGVVSVWIRGVRLSELRPMAGQFLLWRFITPGHLWSAHPYSVSAVTGRHLRITVGAAGDHSSATAHLHPGTPVLAEGPFGSFTPQRRTRTKVLLIAGGTGISPIRALAESFTAPRRGRSDVVVLYRVSGPSNLALRSELDWLAEHRGLRVHYLVGTRVELGYDPLDAAGVGALVPDVGARDVYICGPEGMTAAATRALLELQVPRRQIHTEEFALR